MSKRTSTNFSIHRAIRRGEQAIADILQTLKFGLHAITRIQKA
jgi:hypothetical protein